MSCWWDYEIAGYGDRDKLKELEKALPELTYETVSGDQAQVFHSIRELENHFGFLAIHASRNYGADSPLWGLCGSYPMLTFGGAYHNDIHPEIHYTFEARNGPLAVKEHIDNDCERETVTAAEVKADIEKYAAKIEGLQGELTSLKHYLARHHRDQIGDALSEAEAMEISERIDAEATARPANRIEAIARLTRWIDERRAKEETTV